MNNVFWFIILDKQTDPPSLSRTVRRCYWRFEGGHVSCNVYCGRVLCDVACVVSYYIIFIFMCVCVCALVLCLLA